MISPDLLAEILKGQYKIWIWVSNGSDQVKGYKDRCNGLIPDPTIVGGDENLWFLGAPKCSILELILLEKTWKGIKAVFYKT